jgi:hypothetical protein
VFAYYIDHMHKNMVRGVYLCVFLRNEKPLAVIFIRRLEITNTETKVKLYVTWVKQTTSSHRFFSTSIAPHPSIFSNSGEISARSDEVNVQVRVPGLRFGVSGGCCSPPAIEGGLVAAGRPGGGRG